MHYQHPFVLFLNISVCIILLFLALPSLLNRREALKIRLAFSLIFFTVIVNCTTNVLILLQENHGMVPLVFMAFFIPLLFGPAVYYYVKNLLGSTVGKGIYLTLFPGIACFAYGVFLALADSAIKQHVLHEIIAGKHQLFNVTNFLTLIFIMVYCVKAWVFLKRLRPDERDKFYLQNKLKKAWAKEFIIYIFAPVFTFSILHALVVARVIGVSTMDMDLIWMPVFMLIVYLLIAIRSLMMYKEFEHQFVLARIESEKQIQDQRFNIARDLHDSLGAHLTFIASVSDGLKMNSENLDDHLKAKVSSLSDFTENSITELKNALWILNSNEITLEDLKNKILNFIKAAGEAKEEVQFHFQFPIKENSTIDSKWAVNVFRMVQELVNNAIKYAQAADVWIEMEQSGKMLNLKIWDNGIGFDINTIRANSFGLSNLRKRVQNMDGKLRIDSAKGRGTTCLIELMLQ
jgi:signal transduction histidine kinase